MTDELGTVLVTGGSSGLGAAVVETVAAAGGRPVDGRAAAAAVQRVVERFGGLDAVVTAAGTDACGVLEEVPAEDRERVVMVDLLGTAAVVRAAIPALAASRGVRATQAGGKVVTVASTLELRALSDATAYCGSKFGVVGFTRALALETAGRVGVTLLIPGGMHTAFLDAREERYKPPADAELNRPEETWPPPCCSPCASLPAARYAS